MGCKIQTKFNNSITPNQSARSAIRGDSEIKLSPSIFVQENKSNFSDIYRLGPSMSREAYSETHSCVHRELNVKRCARIYRKDLISNETTRSMMRNEINIQKSLDHPNIVKMFEYFEESKKIYIIYEFCKGGELFSEILVEKNFSESKAAHVMQQLLSVIAYLHSMDMIHNNLRPECILLEEFHNLNNIKV